MKNGVKNGVKFGGFFEKSLEKRKKIFHSKNNFQNFWELAKIGLKFHHFIRSRIRLVQ